MNTLPFYQVDAFASELFKGNPAAVIILDHWLDDLILQRIGAENNLSETAFLVKADGHYELRWFTPVVEVALCGHATLASAHILFKYFETEAVRLEFETRHSGSLFVERDGSRLVLDFPADKIKPIDLPSSFIEAMGEKPREIYQGRSDYMLVYESQRQIEELTPDFYKLKSFESRGIIATATGDDVDFISRFFAPAIDIDEDPVTGSAHTTMAPYWAERLNKSELSARQVSARGGELSCRVKGDRVHIGGDAVIYLEGKVNL